MSDEVWKPVPDFGEYEVSSLGRVRRVKPGQGAVAGRILKWCTNTSNGYPVVTFVVDRRYARRPVHSVVAAAFLGARPSPTHHIRHLDGNKLNCAVSNLAYGTPAENGRDKVLHGRSSYGERNVKAKLSNADVMAIRHRHACGERAVDLAAEYGVCASQVHRVVSRKQWRHLSTLALEASNRRMDRAAQ